MFCWKTKSTKLPNHVYDINSLGELHGINIEAEGQLSFIC